MSSRQRPTQILEPAQRQIVIAVSVAAVTLLTLSASFNLVLGQMLQDLDATESQSDLVRQMPAIGALLVVFLAGTLGDRLGARRVMLACTLLFTVGGVVTAIAPIMGVATFGLLLANVGKSALFVVGLAYMSSSISSKDGRAAAFASFSAVMPVTYLLMPVLAGVILANGSWRGVAATWAISGLLGTAAVWRMLPRERSSQGSGEMLTPALAGVVLAAVVQVITMYPNDGLTARVWFTIAVGAICVIVLVVALRRMSGPTLSLEPLRHGGLVLLLIVLVLTMFANLWFYMTLALQYVFGLTSLQVAVAFIPVQVCSIAGAALSGRLVQRTGVARAGALLLIMVALALGVSMLIEQTTPLWVCITIVSVYSAAAVGAGVALTNAIMDLAQHGDAGSAAAYRGAASNLGSAIGVAVMTSIVFLSAATSLHDQAVAAGIDPSTASVVASAMRDGATSEDASSLYAVPLTEVDQIDSMQVQAYVVGLHSHGLAGGIVTLLSAILFYIVRRRQEAGTLATAVPAGGPSG